MRTTSFSACLVGFLLVGCGGSPFSEAPNQDAGAGGAAGDAGDASVEASDADVEADVSVDVVDGGDAPDEGGSCSDAGSTGLGTIGEPCCSAAELACAGHAQKVVLICDPATMQWIALQACGGQTLCDTQPGMNQGTCQSVVPVCVGLDPGATVCAGNVSVECGPDLVTSVETTCSHACEDGKCVGTCLPGERRCDATTPQLCDGAGAWQSEAPCAYLCTGEGNCSGECSPGTKRCQGNIPQECDGDGFWESGSACAAVCSDGECAGACTSGARQCSGLTTQLCSSAGEWIDGAECDYVCSSGECVGVCFPGTKKCVGLVPQTCDTEGKWQSGTACSYVCDEGVCSGACVPGTKDCVGLTPRTCGVNGQWNPEPPCTYVCNVGECSGECVPGAKQCNGLVPQTCNPAGEWVSGTPCPHVCTAGTCAGSCTPGATQCNGLVPQTCDSSGQWVNGSPCDYVCSNGKCTGVCVPGSKDCNGQIPRTCDADGVWQNGPACLNQACVAGECTGQCEPQTSRCLGRSVQTCASDGQWVSTLCLGATPVCSDGQCVSGGTPGPSCNGLGASCGQGANCCWSTEVPGGAFLRSNDPAYPATVRKFRMDLYEVSVGRFRNFVAVGKGTQQDPPVEGSGAHPKVAGSGWQSEWALQLTATPEALKAALKCSPGYHTWSDNASELDNRPINCVTWYEAFAFCIWDGGRLATEAEWNFAAAGGEQQRVYPWSVPFGSTSLDCSQTSYDCTNNDCGNGVLGCQGMDILAVGSKPAGVGRWGQTDLAGNLREWVFDWRDNYVVPCVDCAAITTSNSAPLRSSRGGHYQSPSSFIRTHARDSAYPYYRGVPNSGIRCVRDVADIT